LDEFTQKYKTQFTKSLNTPQNILYGPSQKYKIQNTISKISEHLPKYSVWTLPKNTKYKIQFPKSLNTFKNILYGPSQKCPTGFFDNEFRVIIKNIKKKSFAGLRPARMQDRRK